MTVLWPDASWLVSELDKQGLLVCEGERDGTVVLSVTGRVWGPQVVLTQSETGENWRVELQVNGTPRRGFLGVPLDEVVPTTLQLLEEEA
jgi:hypothetical protein